MGNNPSWFKNCGTSCPVEQVSWDDVQVYLKRLNALTGKNYRLPTEEEWFYACQAGSATDYCGSNNFDAVGWNDKNSDSRTHAVKMKQANAWGLYDMSGNVDEWQQDCWKDTCDRRVLRGASYMRYSATLDMRSANRTSMSASKESIATGFRVARTLQ